MAKKQQNKVEREFLVTKAERKQAEVLARICLDADVPMILWGEPGTGKSAWLESEAEKRGWHCEVVPLADYALEDLVGPQVPTAEGEVVHKMPPFLKRLWEAYEQGRGTMLFLDELTCAGGEKHALGLRVLSARYVGPHPLPPGCRVAGAANPADLAAGGADLPAPTSNRLEHLWWGPMEITRWVEAVMGGEWTPIRNKYDRRARQIVCSFIQSIVGRNVFQACPTNPEEQTGPWPSQRAWTVLAEKLLPAVLEAGYSLNSPVGMLAVEGQVGPAAANDFAAWLQENDLPSPEDILAGRAKLPKREDQYYAAALALVSYAIEQGDKAVEKAYQVFQEQGKKKPEYTFAACKHLVRARDEGKHNVQMPKDLADRFAEFLPRVLAS